MESRDGDDTGVVCLVVYKSTIALGDELDALNVVSSIARKMVFEIADMHARGEVANPQGAARLFRLPRRAARNGTVQFQACS